jgi:hypothetical protein
MAVISDLEDKPISDPGVQQTFHAIKEAVELEEGTTVDVVDGKHHPAGKASLRELTTGGRSQNFRRVALGVVIQCFQQVRLFNLLPGNRKDFGLLDNWY